MLVSWLAAIDILLVYAKPSNARGCPRQSSCAVRRCRRYFFSVVSTSNSGMSRRGRSSSLSAACSRHAALTSRRRCLVSRPVRLSSVSCWVEVHQALENFGAGRFWIAVPNRARVQGGCCGRNNRPFRIMLWRITSIHSSYFLPFWSTTLRSNFPGDSS